MPSRKGSPNKNKQFLLNRLQDMYGDDFDPIMRAAHQANEIEAIAKQSGEMGDLKTSLDAWLKIGEFTTPKRKAVELTAEVEMVSHEDALDELDPEGEANQADSEG